VLRTNANQLIAMAVSGAVSQPTLRAPGYIPNNEGLAVVLSGMAGIVYNVRTGDSAFGWAADHVEPGVSIANSDEKHDFALHYLTCIGNDATVTSGLAKGAKGIVTGEHARMLVDFSEETYDALAVGDTVQIEALGRGLKLLDYPHIELKKMSPRLLEAMRIEAVDDKTIRVPVAMELPARIMGSGAEINSEFVDQDLMSGDRELMVDLGIDKMRLGDLIAINHVDHHFGRSYRKDAVSICLCIHGDSVMTGHGPGILTIMTCATPNIQWVTRENANLSRYLDLNANSKFEGHL
jgi:Domain of unknown function (DUF4438)